jgi:hypothetical protein
MEVPSYIWQRVSLSFPFNVANFGSQQLTGCPYYKPSMIDFIRLASAERLDTGQNEISVALQIN